MLRSSLLGRRDLPQLGDVSQLVLRGGCPKSSHLVKSCFGGLENGVRAMDTREQRYVL